MNLINIVKTLEGCSNSERFQHITQLLNDWDIDYTIQPYTTGKNILVETSHKDWIGISSHFDVVPLSPGANDNASAIAVCLDILRRLQSYDFASFGVSVFFFDEEEKGLKGSKAYVAEYGTKGLTGLINLEMVGQGDRFALWPLEETAAGRLLQTFEQVARKNGIQTKRFDKIVTNTADHVSFLQPARQDVFTITCISEKEVEAAYHYYKAQEFEVDIETLREIMRKAPVFTHYHQPTDKSIYLSEESLQMTAETIWKTLLTFDQK